MTIAILAFQGAFAEHEQMLRRLEVETFLVRKPEDWQRHKDGVVIPGGESTAMLRIMKDEGLLMPVRQAIADGLPVFGTCAGMILLAKQVDEEARERLATMDITVHRNAYGRQLGSFYAEAPMEGIGERVPMTFIRAPYITEVGEGVEVLAALDGHIVAARQGRQLVTSFHPELNEDVRIHQYFLEMARDASRNGNDFSE
ncbi:MAG: pyridoxal 5'-phosphate synthase glutaminase subunit PdxT [Bacteroidaceae bacterium]|nr:pyridoxal 5'-phosphate synthase glutaminase subunit PdxT [Bacteroidaceae bacterium]